MPLGTGRLDAALMQRRLWTPRNLPVRPSQWLDAAALETLTLDSALGVGKWDDLSGNGQYAQHISGGKPKWSASAMWGYPAVYQTATAATLEHYADPGSGAVTVWMVVRMDSLGNSPIPMYSAYTSGGKRTINLRARENVSGWALPYVNQVSEVSSRVLVSATPEILVGAYDGSTGFLYYSNGKLTDTKTLTPATAGADSKLIGSTVTESWYIASCGYVGAKLSDADIQKLTGYLAWRYGLQRLLDAQNPYLNSPPLIGA